MKQTLHVVGLPHSKITPEYTACAFTSEVRLFSQMMTERGYHVVLYGPEGSEAECTEFVEVISTEEQEAFFGEVSHEALYPIQYDVNQPYWKLFNKRVAREMIKSHLHGNDVHCAIAGNCSAPVAEAILPRVPTVEFAIGYAGTFADYRVYKSYAWMHNLYGRYGIKDGPAYDAVIPSYFPPDTFPEASEEPDDYLLFVGRIIERKGLHIALEVAKETGRRLVVAGQGAESPEPGVLITHDRSMAFEYEKLEFKGHVFPDERNALMNNAAALMVPTVYIEPFGNVAVEAQLCGTPVISSDWGAFPETVAHGKSGFRCRTLDQYVKAVDQLSSLDRKHIRSEAIRKWSFDAVAPMYEEFFTQLWYLSNGRGWYEVNRERKSLDWLER